MIQSFNVLFVGGEYRTIIRKCTGAGNERVCHARQGKDMKKLSVIIVTFNKVDIVRNCLDSIKKYNDIGDELEVIISDNSTEGILAQTIPKEFPWVKFIKNENEGFGAGNNRGFEISCGEYLLFLNPDTVLIEPIFKFAIEKFESNKELALFGVQLVKSNLKRNHSFFIMDQYGICALMKSKVAFLFNKYHDGKMFISGADLFVRRESFEQAGRFDENIFMYKEEADLIKRIKLHAEVKDTRFFKQKSIIHLEGGTELQSGEQKLVVAERIMKADRYYCRKYNMSLDNILKQRIRRAKLKKLCYLFVGKKKEAFIENQLMEYYEQNRSKCIKQGL